MTLPDHFADVFVKGFVLRIGISIESPAKNLDEQIQNRQYAYGVLVGDARPLLRWCRWTARKRCVRETEEGFHQVVQIELIQQSDQIVFVQGVPS